MLVAKYLMCQAVIPAASLFEADRKLDFSRRRWRSDKNPAQYTTQDERTDRQGPEQECENPEENDKPPVPLVFKIAEAGLEPARGLPPTGF